ncbi:viral enhancin protein [Enterococcus hirae]|uniref:toxin Cry1Ac domain D-VI-related protein n=1 Tax=Enterococcus hirae TaxID=1354 RepID=UPI000BBC6B2E|nr:toxin Cry1Ac domain D-VI-related protein [Enterococcus hirae]PCE02221.1 viral enhancin protein [Enterococcus hirae]
MKAIRLLGATLLASTTLLGVGSAFAATSVTSVEPDPASAKTPITAELTIGNPGTVTPPSQPGEGGGDQGTGISGLFGIAYAPGTLSGQAQLNASGEQKVDLSNNTATKYNVGVQDKTRKNTQNWTLKASLSWDGDTNNYMAGTTIQATGGNVKENVNGNLQTLANSEVSTSAQTLKISSVETTVMQSSVGKTMNGVYNYQFENPQLVIPEVSKVAAGTYSGNITWNLANTPIISTDIEIMNAVNNLFNANNSLKESVTQQTINDTQKLVNQVSNQVLKKELQDKINQAQKLLNQRPIVYTIETSIKPTNTLNAGILMGNGHDRQDLGFQLEKGSIIKIKQINSNFKENLTLRLLTNDSHTESSVVFSKDEVELTAKDLCVPFIDTPYNQPNGEKPIVEISIQGGKRNLPKYTSHTDFTSFSNQWNSTSGYALIQGKRFQIFLPPNDKNTTLATNLNQVINMYDNDIIGFYNELIGLSDYAENPINQASVRRYFYKADKHGTGGLYYGGIWAAESSSSAADWLSDGWGVLHETGHGYQGNFMNKGMSVGEVWNNLYGVIYNYKHMGKTAADKNSWLYNYGYKSELEADLNKSINSSNPQFNKEDVRHKLIILSNIIDKAGNEGLQHFYTKYREYASQNSFNSSNYSLPDLFVSNLGSPRKYDFSAVLTAWGLNVSDQAKKVAKENNYQPVAHLAQVVPNDKLSEAINRFTANNRLSSVLSLVTNKELDEMGLTSNVTLQIPDKELFEGTHLKIYRDNQLYCKVPLNKENITLDMPNGVYSLELDSNVGYLSRSYLFVKDNQVINIPLVNYVKEATQVVQSLYQENTEKIKSDIMQKDIDYAKKYVDALPESQEKSALLTKLENAYNQLQEFTFRGLGDWTFATLDVANEQATIRINSGKPHSYISYQYASISITRQEKEIYNKVFIGDKNYSSEINRVSLETGDLVTIKHIEANDTRLAVNHSYLKNNRNGNYHYIVEKGLLKLIS